MNLSTIQTAHTLDFAIRLAGRLTSLAALMTIQYPDLEVGDPPTPGHRVVPDHVLVHGRLSGGGALAVQVAGGRPADDTPFRMDLVGEDGVLTLTGGAPRGFQSGLLSLALNGRRIDVDGGETAGLPASAVNVAGVYAALRDDIRHHTSTAPNFDDAVRLSHLIDDLHTSAAGQRTVTPSADWP
jgi:predicted dehydrogenase